MRGLPNNLEGFLNYGHREMGAVVDETGYVVFWHFGKLFLEDTLQTGEDNKALARVVIVDHPELDFTGALFNHSGLKQQECYLRKDAITLNVQTHLFRKGDNFKRSFFCVRRGFVRALGSFVRGLRI